jgi:hypothetical protein
MNGETVAAATPAAAVRKTLRRDAPAFITFVCPFFLLMVLPPRILQFLIAARAGPVTSVASC